MTTATKTFAARVKATGDQLDAGQFEAIVSVFGNIDSYGDVVRPGAFTDTLGAWKSSGDPIPVIWSHQWSDVDAHIGVVLDAKELLPGDTQLPPDLTALGGLWVRCQLDDDGKAVKVRSLLKGGRVKNFSFAYDVLDAAWVRVDGRDAYELRKLDLYEVGPCLIGANTSTELIAAKEATRPPGAQTDDTSGVKDPAIGEEPADHPADKAHPSRPRLPAAELALLDA